MARVNRSTTIKKIDKEDNVEGFNLTYNYEIADNKVIALSCSGVKREGMGNCFVTWQRGVSFPNASFNNCLANPDLQTHINAELTNIVADVEGVATQED